ncbi:MAG: hypothetical protein CM1200mP2_43710 [Planctomycetaceae bacterium]|nr:MAG: hypothetical protein CM1200mP2_43710 [Planctomycetaceae bacterium]
MRLKRPVAVGALSMVIVAGVCSMPLWPRPPGRPHVSGWRPGRDDRHGPVGWLDFTPISTISPTIPGRP